MVLIIKKDLLKFRVWVGTFWATMNWDLNELSEKISRFKNFNDKNFMGGLQIIFPCVWSWLVLWWLLKKIKSILILKWSLISEIQEKPFLKAEKFSSQVIEFDRKYKRNFQSSMRCQKSQEMSSCNTTLRI